MKKLDKSISEFFMWSLQSQFKLLLISSNGSRERYNFLIIKPQIKLYTKSQFRPLTNPSNQILLKVNIKNTRNRFKICPN